MSSDGFYSIWRPWSGPVIRFHGWALHGRSRITYPTSWPIQLRRVAARMRPVRR